MFYSLVGQALGHYWKHFCEGVMMNEAQSSPKSGIDSDKSLLKKKKKQGL